MQELKTQRTGTMN